ALAGGAASGTLEAPRDFLGLARWDKPAHQIPHARALEAQQRAERRRQLAGVDAVDAHLRQAFGCSRLLVAFLRLAFEHRDRAGAAPVRCGRGWFTTDRC